MAQLLIITLLLASSSILADPQGQKFIPAAIGSHSNSLTELIEVPKVTLDEKFRQVIYCNTKIKKDGSSVSPYCNPDKNSKLEFSVAVTKAARKATFIPALVDGNPVKVIFLFRVVFDCEKGECSVFGIPNIGFNQGKLGLAYYSPQMISDNEDWADKLKRRRQSFFADSVIERIPHSRIMSQVGPIIAFSVSAKIDTDGNASDWKIEEIDITDKRHVKNAIKIMKLYKFIPGFTKDGPTEMRWYETAYKH